jgi:integrase
MANLRRMPFTKPIPANAQLFTRKGKRYARYKDASGKTAEAPLNEAGTRIQLLSRKWYGEYRDADGIEQCVPLSANKTAAEQMLAELVRKAEYKKANLSDPFEEHRGRPLAEHLDDFEASLRNKGDTETHARLVSNRCRRIVQACGFVFMADVSASRVQEFLADLRNVEGMSIQTSNFYLSALKQFCRWLVKDRRMSAADNPVLHLSGGNVKLDRRHDRRNLELDELHRVLNTAGSSKRKFRGLAGLDRRMLYLTAAATGLRVSELGTRCPSHFNLDAKPPTVQVEPGYVKNRKDVTQPLPPDIAEALAVYLAGKPNNKPIWPGTWVEKAATMLRKDLAAARAAWIAEAQHPQERERREQSDYLAYRDGAGKVADFHALRHSYITLLERSGVSVKHAMELARHSDIRLTMNRYTHAALYDLGAAVENLPRLIPPGPAAEPLAATGTDGSACASLRPACAGVENSCVPVMSSEIGEANTGSAADASPTLKIKAFASDCESMRTPEKDYARRDSNPQPTVPKCGGLIWLSHPQSVDWWELAVRFRVARRSRTCTYFTLFCHVFQWILYHSVPVISRAVSSARSPAISANPME